MRYTPQGTAVCTFGVATNRSWTTDSGEKKEDAEFHNIVAWNKLAEICAQLLKKGRKVFVEGRLSTRTWQGQDGAQRNRTEVVITDMVILDKKTDEPSSDIDIPEPTIESQEPQVAPAIASAAAGKKAKAGKEKKAKGPEPVEGKDEEPTEEDIPF